MRRLALIVTALLFGACASEGPTYLVVRIESGSAVEADSYAVAVRMGNMQNDRVLALPAGGTINLPTSAHYLLKSGSGIVVVEVRGFKAPGTQVASGRAWGCVERGRTTTVSVLLGQFEDPAPGVLCLGQPVTDGGVTIDGPPDAAEPDATVADATVTDAAADAMLDAAPIDAPIRDAAAPDSAASFDPSTIAGMTGWFDASRASTLTIAAGRVTEWRDRRAGFARFSQATTTSQPATGSAIGSLNSITFDGIDDHLDGSSAAMLDGSSGAVFAVVRFQGSSLSQSNPVLRVFGTSGSALLVGLNQSGTPQMAYPEITFTGTGTAAVRSTTALARNTGYQLTWFSNGFSYGIRRNGVAQTLTGTNNGNWAGDVTTSSSAPWLGGLSGDSVSYSIGELLIYDIVTLTATEIVNIETYLRTKWGLP